jgi:regulator of sigma E protease
VAVVQTILWFIVALVVLVAVHEFGHFYVARRCGVKVLRFSIGFGKVLFSRRDRHGTEFAFAAIPLGGYVKMLDERDSEVPEHELQHAFTRKTVWQRMAIVIAGPVANFLLAILLFWGLLLGGERGLAPVIGSVEASSIAAHAGLDAGQEIIAVDGEPTPTRQALYQRLLHRLGESGVIQFSLRYPDSEFEYQAEVRLDKWLQGDENPDPVAGLGLSLYVPEAEPVAHEILPNSPAERAGLKAGDIIRYADGKSLASAPAWIEYVRARPGESLAVEVEREGRLLSLSLVPESIVENGVSYGRVGMAMVPPSWPESMIRHTHYSVVEALGAGLEKTWSTTGFVFLSIKKLLVGEISTKNLSGPVSIAKVAGSSAQGGMGSYIAFLALLSIFLGVFNLLPIPVLDGGHLLYYLIEAVKGSPISEKAQMLGYQVGLFLVIGLSLVALYNDIARL